MRDVISAARGPRYRTVSLFLVSILIFGSGCGDPAGETEKVRQAREPAAPLEPETFTSDQAAPFVQLALDCAVQEYPNKIAHTMQSDADQGTPGSLHPAFYGCFDWHSSVHGHWLLARFARLYPEHPWRPARALFWMSI